VGGVITFADGGEEVVGLLAKAGEISVDRDVLLGDVGAGLVQGQREVPELIG
jgi:hypothetical protein